MVKTGGEDSLHQLIVKHWELGRTSKLLSDIGANFPRAMHGSECRRRKEVQRGRRIQQNYTDLACPSLCFNVVENIVF